MKCDYCKQEMEFEHRCKIQNKAVNALINKREKLFFNNDYKHLAGSDQASLEITKHHNGSGYPHFNKAKEWPHITLHLSLPTHTTATKIKEIEKDLKNVLNKHGFK